MSCMSEGSSSRPDLLAGQLYKHRGTLVPIKPFNQVLLDLREGKVEAAEALDRRSVGASALVRYFVSLPQKDAQHTPMEACFKACSGEKHEAGWHCRMCKVLISTRRDFCFFDAYVHFAHAECTALDHTKRQRFMQGIDSVDKDFINNYRKALPQKHKEKQTPKHVQPSRSQKTQAAGRASAETTTTHHSSEEALSTRSTSTRWRKRSGRTSERARRAMCTDSDLEDVENASEPSSASDDESADDEEDDCEDEHRDDPDGRHDAVTGRCEAVAAIERPTARAGHVASAEDEEEQDELDDSSSDVGQLSVLASAKAVRKASNAVDQPAAKRQKKAASTGGAQAPRDLIDLTLDESDDEAGSGPAAPGSGQPVIKREPSADDNVGIIGEHQQLLSETSADVKAERRSPALRQPAGCLAVASGPHATRTADPSTARAMLPSTSSAQSDAVPATRASPAFSAVSSQAEALADIVARRDRRINQAAASTSSGAQLHDDVSSSGAHRHYPSPALSTSPSRPTQPPGPPVGLIPNARTVQAGSAAVDGSLSVPAFLSDCRLRTFAKVGITDKDMLDQLLASALEKEDHQREIDLFVDEVLAGKRVPLTEAEITVLKRGLSDHAARVKGQR